VQVSPVGGAGRGLMRIERRIVIQSALLHKGVAGAGRLPS
jgi:hypothetical protein